MTDLNSAAGETAVLDIAGKVTIGHDAKMRDAIDEALDSGAKNILLNLKGVSKIDSSGIGELVAAHNRITDSGGRLLLVSLSERIGSVLQIVNLMGVLETFDTIDDALAALEVESS
jgi:anti-sigma B factor antagonist